MAHLGMYIKDKHLEKVSNYLNQWLVNDEKIIAFFGATQMKPQIDGLVLTSHRIITLKGTRLGDVKFVNDLAADDIAGFSVEKGVYKAMKVFVDKKDGEKIFIGSMYKDDALLVNSFLSDMHGSPQSLLKKIEASKIAGKAERNRVATEQKQQRAEVRQAQQQASADAKQLAINRASSGQCPKCGSNNLQAVHSATQKGFSDTGACSGCCCLGPVGLLCGFCGSGKKQEQSYRMCLNCGNKF